MIQIRLPWSLTPLTKPAADARCSPVPQQPGPTDREPQLEFVRHPRARRYVIRLTDRGIVRVTIPRWGSKREALAFVDHERAWIDKQWRRYVASRDQRQALPGLDPHQLSDAKAQRERARRELPLRLMALASTLGVADRVSRVSVRNQKWRWGSCSPSGHICLNWRLVTMPDAVRDYVLIHELMHLKRMDHSPKFWRLVAEACPDYRAHRLYLRAQKA